MDSIALLCSGQGYQAADMFDLLANAPEADPVFKYGRLALGGADPREFVRRESSDVLHADKVGQLLCCIQAIAAWAVLKEKVSCPRVVAGYSVGELAAWGVAGLLDDKEVFRLVLERAAAMDEATKEPSGLVAIRGLKCATLDPICTAHGAYIAIVNGEDQLLVGGTRRALDAVIHDAQAAGAERTTILPVAVAAHTPLLADASDRFRRALSEVPLPAEVPPNVRLLSGIDGATVFAVRAGAERLALQIQQTVRWVACMQSCRAAGVSKVVELGPGNALAGLMRGVIPDGDVHSFSEFQSLPGFEHWVLSSSP
jgi:[acyl-carrier-protein] S-malonyltransferase